MSKFNFKSAICTSREQSERLLALGLKKETADAIIPIKFNPDKAPILVPQDFWISDDPFYRNIREGSIPAWSLGRLLEIMRMKASSQIVPLDDTFDRLIEGIETRIKEGYFNKEYLV